MKILKPIRDLTVIQEEVSDDDTLFSIGDIDRELKEEQERVQHVEDDRDKVGASEDGEAASSNSSSSGSVSEENKIVSVKKEEKKVPEYVPETHHVKNLVVELRVLENELKEVLGD